MAEPATRKHPKKPCRPRANEFARHRFQGVPTALRNACCLRAKCADVNEAMQAFEAARDRTIEFTRTVEGDLRSHFSNHGVLGPPMPINGCSATRGMWRLTPATFASCESFGPLVKKTSKCKASVFPFCSPSGIVFFHGINTTDFRVSSSKAKTTLIVPLSSSTKRIPDSVRNRDDDSGRSRVAHTAQTIDWCVQGATRPEGFDPRLRGPRQGCGGSVTR